MTVVIVRGLGDIGSAVAHLLFREGYGVVIHDDPRPATTRRGMAFADAAFDGQAELDGVRAVRTDGAGEIARALERRNAVPVHVGPLGTLLAGLGHQVLIDARVRKRAAPEVQLADAELTVVAWGSTKGTILDAMKVLAEQGKKINFLQCRLMKPFPAEAVGGILHRAKRIVYLFSRAARAVRTAASARGSWVSRAVSISTRMWLGCLRVRACVSPRSAPSCGCSRRRSWSSTV